MTHDKQADITATQHFAIFNALVQHAPRTIHDYLEQITDIVMRAIDEPSTAWAFTTPAQPVEVERLRAAAIDALSGWRYIRQVHGDLPGVGWDRVEDALSAALRPEGEASRG